MQKFIEKTFNIGELKGISRENIEEHLKLYSLYVKNANLVLEKIAELEKDSTTNAYLLGELGRRFAFEFGGVRNHEYFFESLSSDAKEIKKDSALFLAIEKDFGSFEIWLNKFKLLAMTRGIGWAMLSYDKETGQLLNQWVDEQHLGHLVSTSPILALDVWEHSYVSDYKPSGKKQYIEDFFANLNWEIIENNFKN